MAEDSIAVVDLDRCQPDRCNYECANFCPPNRTGKECIVTREERYEAGGEFDGKPDQISISEEICLGETCGICVEKCPFDAIEIINLPQELEEEPTAARMPASDASVVTVRPLRWEARASAVSVAIPPGRRGAGKSGSLAGRPRTGPYSERRGRPGRGTSSRGSGTEAGAGCWSSPIGNHERS